MVNAASMSSSPTLVTFASDREIWEEIVMKVGSVRLPPVSGLRLAETSDRSVSWK